MGNRNSRTEPPTPPLPPPPAQQKRDFANIMSNRAATDPTNGPAPKKSKLNLENLPELIRVIRKAMADGTELDIITGKWLFDNYEEDMRVFRALDKKSVANHVIIQKEQIKQERVKSLFEEGDIVYTAMNDILPAYGAVDEHDTARQCIGWNVRTGNSDANGKFEARVKNNVYEGRSVVYLEQNVLCQETKEAMRLELNRRYDDDLTFAFQQYAAARLLDADSTDAKQKKFKLNLLENRKAAEQAHLRNKIETLKEDNLKKVISYAVLPTEVSDLQEHITVNVKGGVRKCPTCVQNETILGQPVPGNLVPPPVLPVPDGELDPVTVHVQFVTKASLSRGATA